jgi:4-diphosphocytidyl-2-C-methyl-D-erythritol kinase
MQWLKHQHNDLEAPAIAQHPEISEALAVLRRRAEVARMSGSGATCFGIFATEAAADATARAIRVARPNWWIVAAAA